MSNQYQAVAAILQNTITSINAILTSPDDEMHRIRIENRLRLEADQLLLLTGSGDLATGQPAVLGPATTIGGKPIGKVRKFTEADMIPSDDKVHQLKEAIEEALEYFGPDASAEGILARIPELIIRGVAKKAGLKVTKDEPKELTVEFIGEIQAALAAQNGLKPEETKGRLSVEDLSKIKEALKDETKSAPNETIPPVTETKVSVLDEVNAATQDQLNKGIENAIMGGDPSAPVGDGLLTKPATEQPKAEESKQEPKPDTKKKTGK